MKRDIVILGTGGCARELHWLVEDNNESAAPYDRWNVLGFVEPEVEAGQMVNDLPVFQEAWLLQQDGISVICGVGDAKNRKRVAEKLLEKNPSLKFPTILSKRAQISGRVEMGQGCVVCAGAILTCNIKMGDFIMVNLGSIIAHDVTVGSFTQINTSVSVSGGVTIGDCVQIGTGVKIIPHIHIGNRAVLGAGSVIIKDVKDGQTVFGCPARVISAE